MRWMCWFAAMLSACVLADGAFGLDDSGPVATTTECSSCNGMYGTATAPACCFGGFGMAPGCCEYRPTCCDHVWATYCQGKAYRLQRHAMRQAARPVFTPYGPMIWGAPIGLHPTMAPPAPVPQPDPNTGA